MDRARYKIGLFDSKYNRKMSITKMSRKVPCRVKGAKCLVEREIMAWGKTQSAVLSERSWPGTRRKVQC